MTIKKVQLYGILCDDCGTILVSRGRYDFRRCGCLNESFVDGGQTPSIRIGGKDLTKIRSVVITYEQDDEQTIS